MTSRISHFNLSGTRKFETDSAVNYVGQMLLKFNSIQNSTVQQCKYSEFNRNILVVSCRNVN